MENKKEKKSRPINITQFVKFIAYIPWDFNDLIFDTVYE